MGPDCREKYMRSVAVDDAARVEANAIVYKIAAERTQAGRGNTGIWRSKVVEAVARLRSLGFTSLAERILGAVKPDVIVSYEADELVIQTPYNESFVAYVRGIPGRRWDSHAKANRFPVSAKREVWFALRNTLSGMLGNGPKGDFLIA